MATELNLAAPEVKEYIANYKSLYESVEALRSDHEKFLRGNFTAGIRLRKLLQVVKAYCCATRKSIQLVKSASASKKASKKKR